MNQLLQQYRAITSSWERSIFKFFAAGWNPSSGFDEYGRLAFDVTRDIDRIPTRKYSFTHLNESLIPVIVYLCIIIFGHIIFSLNDTKNKKPFISSSLLYSLKFVYNVIQIFLCAYMSMESIILANRRSYDLYCSKFNFSEPVFGKLLWLFYVSKIFDFSDTVFIILGNKYSQFTFLHKYHHITIYFIYWININLAYDSDIYLTIAMNAFVHTIMYMYYLISMHMPKEIDPKTNKPKYGIWWKKYLTVIQMIQFVCMITQAILGLAMGCNELPPPTGVLYLCYILSLFAMFMNFFMKSYGQKKVAFEKKSN